VPEVVEGDLVGDGQAEQVEEPVGEQEAPLAPRPEERPRRFRLDEVQAGERVVEEHFLRERHPRLPAVTLPLPLVGRVLHGVVEAGRARRGERLVNPRPHLTLDPRGIAEDAETELPIGLAVPREEEAAHLRGRAEAVDERDHRRADELLVMGGVGVEKGVKAGLVATGEDSFPGRVAQGPSSWSG
jgi:hypothetical protein